MNNVYKGNGQNDSSVLLTCDNISGYVFVENPQSLEHFLVSQIPLWKCLIDLIGASFLIILFLPVFVVTYLLIKIVSPGPVFFKQVRTGYIGKPFIIWKFRTMYINADSSLHANQICEEFENDLVLTKVKNDPRIFPFGNLLRNSCIDELPQLFNVLKGEMSLVGPRPELPYAVEKFKLWHCVRLNVLPGLTGLWQINGKNSTTFTEMIRYDIEYVRHLSFKLDIKILLLTIPAIISHAWLSRKK
ncbi:MAG: sugar transferase [Candidatus Scalindua sp. AMX11]|nr:MAG: sugar transferase [Candidatus Scalindua sp.]NOG83478.1 sugar transferase [Planctomycetota bacterium]RZV72906.1 MAG: sugar transferase [Candidatus Scalindua sp. SCAELEC01]TDE64797.1 MAG: sugar transferase [Candidatus Scalindua sp. AMX11]